MNVLVIGAGLYVCGRGTDGVGTILPTLVEAQRDGEIGELWVAATRPDSARELRRKLGALDAALGARAQVRVIPEGGEADPVAYRKALAAMPKPACALVAVPDHLHAQIAADVIQAELHVWVVKPLTATVTEAQRLIGLLEAHGRYGAVDFHKRYDEANLLLRQAIADGQLGELRTVTVQYSQRRLIREAFASWIRHTNVFQYLGVHYADLIHFVTGARPVRALAIGQPALRAGSDLSALDAIQAFIDWEDPATGRSFGSSILASWTDPERSPAMSDQAITVLGTAGRYESDQMRRGVRLITDAGAAEVNPYFSQRYADAGGRMGMHGYGPESIRQFLRDARDLAQERCRPADLIDRRPSFQDSLVSTAVVEAVNHSLAAGGEWIAMDEVVEATQR